MGDDAPPTWQGALNFTYRLGPGFLQPDRKVQMFISTHNQNVSVYNAFGVIKGAIEPGNKNIFLHIRFIFFLII